MAYTVVACTVTPAAGEDREPTTKSIVDDAAECTVQDPGMGRPVK